MNKRKTWVSAMALVLVAVMLLGLVASAVITMVSARSSAQIKNDIGDLEDEQQLIEDRLDELAAQRTENMNEMKDVVGQKNIIDQEIALLYDQVDVINQQISVYNTQIADKQEELELAEDRLAFLNEKNKERIRAMEEDGAVSYWSVLFKANSFSDLLDRLNMIAEIAAADQRRLDEMSQVAERIAKVKEELEQQKAGLQETKLELDASQAELEEKRAQADELLAELNIKGETFDAMIGIAEEENTKLLEELAKLEVELDEAEEREYQQWLAQQQASKPSGGNGGGNAGGGGSGEWRVPCSYIRLTSPFGYRIHPIYGDWRFHSGVDLAGPLNTPIYATCSGVVKAATYNGSAGNYVSIDHMDGFSSTYMHMTRYVVGVGDWVAAGDLIGYMGSTGASTGSHLHFSVYKNGTAVNPCDYVYLR